MSEKQTEIPAAAAAAEPQIVRPTKKQQELLKYIETFIAEHGYSPSYREIMNALNYTSVATVALHVGNLIKRGHLVKRGRSARSLEVVKHDGDNLEPAMLPTNQVKPDEGKWLIDEITKRVTEAENDPALERKTVEELFILTAAAGVLGLEGAAQSFVPRLSALREKTETTAE